MSRFDIGDKVKIVRTQLGSQREYIGCVREVVKTDIDGAFLDNMPDDDEYYLDSELALIEPNVDGLYPYMIDIKTCGKNLFDNYKIQTDFYEKYIKGIWEIEEEKDMNKVVNLWCERKRNKIIDKYDELEVEFNTTKYSVVESFNELVQRFNEDLESLYKMDKATEQFVLKENAPNNVVKYCIDYERINKEFEEEYRNKRDEELKEIKDIKDEVEAQLSLSNDLEYQQEVLIRYGIIDKKTKKIAD